MDLFDFIKKSPTPFHAVDTVAALLESNGFIQLQENDIWELRPNSKYFVTRNMSSLIAFKTPKDDFSGFMITAAHSDSPCFKIKDNALISDGKYARLSSERYGVMIKQSWFDRPLSVAGRLIIRTPSGIETRLVDIESPIAIIPHLAPHMHTEVSYDFNSDMLPLFDTGTNSLLDKAAGKAGINKEDIISFDLSLYVADSGYTWNSFISAPRLDDLECAYASLVAFLDSEDFLSMPVYCLFDNEEVGSTTKQGAASTFLYDVLSKIVPDLSSMLPNSFMASCDNAHAVHPNHPELSDKNHSVYMNEGVVIKYNANQKYTTDAISAGIFKYICHQANAPYQIYTNRADITGGSTLGNIASTQVSVNTVDIGLAQLAMHSAFETAGKLDVDIMIQALKAMFESEIKMQYDGSYSIKTKSDDL